MYIVPQYEPRIRLISRDGSETIYDNYEEFLEHNSLYFVRNHVVTTFRDYPEGRRVYLTWEERQMLDLYIVRDEFGSVFSAGEIIHDQEKRCLDTIIHSRWGADMSHHIYRENPVPGTGKSRWGFGHYYRHPKTTQEKRWAEAHKNYVRGKRRKHAIPDAWDDILRGDVGNRKNWKQNRKTQWKER